MWRIYTVKNVPQMCQLWCDQTLVQAQVTLKVIIRLEKKVAFTITRLVFEYLPNINKIVIADISKLRPSAF